MHWGPGTVCEGCATKLPADERSRLRDCPHRPIGYDIQSTNDAEQPVTRTVACATPLRKGRVLPDLLS
eukprot:15263289-Heterocapsa_arctica.AAC.1